MFALVVSEHAPPVDFIDSLDGVREEGQGMGGDGIELHYAIICIIIELGAIRTKCSQIDN